MGLKLIHVSKRVPLWKQPELRAKTRFRCICLWHVIHFPWPWQRRSHMFLPLYLTTHDDVIKWNYFPRNWPFVRGIHRSTQRPVTRSFDVFFDLRLNKRLSKQPWGWWFETLSWSLWRHGNAEIEPKTCLPWKYIRIRPIDLCLEKNCAPIQRITGVSHWTHMLAVNEGIPYHTFVDFLNSEHG